MRRFRPAILPTLLTLILLPVFIRLGFWQLDRAEQKEAIELRLQQRAQQPSFLLEQVVQDLSGFEYRPVYVSGFYDHEHQILVDNCVYQGQAGYHVLTLLKSV